MKKNKELRNIRNVFGRWDMDIPEHKKAWELLIQQDKEFKNRGDMFARAVVGYFQEMPERETERREQEERFLKRVEDTVFSALGKIFVGLQGKSTIPFEMHKEETEKVSEEMLDFAESFLD